MYKFKPQTTEYIKARNITHFTKPIIVLDFDSTIAYTYNSEFEYIFAIR